jgi:chitinase
MTDIAYDIPNIAKSVDAINLMTFDYAGAWQKKIGFGSPLHSDRQQDVKAAIDLYIGSGAPIEKLILGIPFYGRTFTAKNEYRSDIGDESENEGFGGPFVNDKKSLGYNEFCKIKTKKDWTYQFNTGASQMIGKFVEDGKMNVVTFETPRSVANKVKFAMENGLLGVWAWSTDTDDFNGLCPTDQTAYNDFGYKKPPMIHERDFPLLRTINNVMRFMEAKR